MREDGGRRVGVSVVVGPVESGGVPCPQCSGALRAVGGPRAGTKPHHVPHPRLGSAIRNSIVECDVDEATGNLSVGDELSFGARGFDLK